MKEENVDLLIIGDLACTTYISCTSKGSITCGANLVEITAPNIPDYIDLYDIRFHLKNAIVMDAKGSYVNATSTFAPDGKHIFATGKVLSRGIDVKTNTMGTTDYVSYELAVELKAAGFNEPCDSYYDKACAADDEYWRTKREEAYNWNGLDSNCQTSAPTLAHAQKWLREKCGLHVVGLPCMDSASDADGQVCDEWQFWFFDIMQVSTARFLVDGEGRFDSYEQALSEGIKSALELIKKGEEL